MRYCDNCLRRHWRAKIDKRTGKQVVHNSGCRVFVCIYCGNVQEEERAPVLPDDVAANILYIDVEISKSLVYNYGLRVPTKYISPDNLVRERYMISWAASYVGNDRVWSDCVTPSDAKRWDDKNIVRGLWEIMTSAEIIAGHNVNGFDIKQINTRFKKHGLRPIVGKKVLDTLSIARRTMAFESNRLDFISKWLGFDGKDDITNADWLAALEGDKKTLDKIHKYNRGDVINGKKVLMELLPNFNKARNFGAVKGRI